MRIKQYLTQSRRDFSAIMICEHCEQEATLNSGYDDANYHDNVIPNMVCKSCGEKAPTDSVPATPRYAASAVV
jgi:protein-arginine kinase activator protein McsA